MDSASFGRNTPPMKTILVGAILLPAFISAQIHTFPYRESFDTSTPPALPDGWTATTHKSASGDFTTTATSVRSSPFAVSSVDATKEQSLISPYFSFAGKVCDTLEFYERRTSSHTSGVLIEAAVGSDTLFSLRLSDTLTLINSTSYVRRAVAIPSILDNTDSVRFRWRVIGNGSGATGVIRLDDITVSVKKVIDLGISSIAYAPAAPKKGDTLIVTAVVRNRALTGYFSGTVMLFDSLTLIRSEPFAKNLAANESVLVTLTYPDLPAGRHPLKAILSLTGDEDTTNNSVSVTVTAGSHPRIVLINEIMYAPNAGTPEWIECINTGSEPLPLTGWKVSDGGTTRAAVVPADRPLPPRSYCIITTDTTAFKNTYTVSAPLYQASFSALNNSGDAVVLYDQTGSVIDSLTYSAAWGGTNGRALERIDTAVSSTNPANWKTSVHPDGATPGAINSVSKKEYDISVGTMLSFPANPVFGNTVFLSAVVNNIGRKNSPVIALHFYVDANADSILDAGEQFALQSVPSLAAGDSAVVTIPLPSLVQGSHRTVVVATAAQDDDVLNNAGVLLVTIGLPKKSIVISEIMYAPAGDMPEWIEGFNATDQTVSVSGWKSSDAGSTRSPIAGRNAAVPPRSYFVITTDTVQFLNYFSGPAQLFQSSFSALNNTTPDAVVLYDERGAVMDSVSYRQTWGGSNGESLQRFDLYGSSADSANWRSSVPSPGIENSVGRKDDDISLSPVIITKQSDDFLVHTVVRNSGRNPAAQISVVMYHDINNDAAGQTDEVIDTEIIGLLDVDADAAVSFRGTIADPGKHRIIVRAEYDNDRDPSNNAASGWLINSFLPRTVVINEIMYEPVTGHAEFVELLNRSGDTVDVAGWNLMDQPGSSGSRTVIPLSASMQKIPPNGFVLAASDSSVFNEYPALLHSPVVIHSALSLSNSGEDLVLTDLTGIPIDSIRYSPAWHLHSVITSGRSLERIDPNGSTNDSRNWSSSVARSGATPGRNNSIVIGSAAAGSAMTLVPNPFSPDQDGFEDFLSINFSLPAASSTIRVRIFDVAGRLIRRLAGGEPVPASGSLIWNGLDDDGHRVRIGMYIILFEAFDNFGGTVKTMKDVAVVARKLR